MQRKAFCLQGEKIIFYARCITNGCCVGIDHQHLTCVHKCVTNNLHPDIYNSVSIDINVCQNHTYLNLNVNGYFSHE